MFVIILVEENTQPAQKNAHIWISTNDLRRKRNFIPFLWVGDRWRSTSDRDEQQGGAEEKLQNREAAIYTHTSISVRMMHGRGSFRCCLLASQPKSPSSLLAVLPSLSRTRRYMITHVHGAPTTTPRGCSPAQAATRPPPRHWRRRGGPPSS